MKKGLSILLLLALLALSLSYAVPAAAEATLTDVSIAADNYTAGGTGLYTITFTPTKTTAIKTVSLLFPAGFNVAGIAGNSTISLPLGVWGINGQTITYTVNSPVEQTLAEITITLNSIINNQTSGEYTVDVTTGDASSAMIDAGTSPAFDIVPAGFNADSSSLEVDKTEVRVGETVNVTVTPKDEFGNRLGAGQTVVVKLDDNAADIKGPIEVTDAGDGTYTAAVTISTVTIMTENYDQSLVPAPNIISATVGGTAVTQTRQIMATAGIFIIVGEGEEYPYDSIQQAIDDAQEGDVVQVHAGVYEEFITIDKSITVEAVLQEGEEAVIKPVAGIDTPLQAVNITGRNVIFSGFSIVINLDNPEVLWPDTGIAVNQFIAPGFVETGPEVYITGNNITIDFVPEARGIAAYNREGLVSINNNTITIGEQPEIAMPEQPTEPGYNTDCAYGIDIGSCNTVKVQDNRIDIYTYLQSIAVSAVDCFAVQAYHNTLNAEVSDANRMPANGPDTLVAYGITISDEVEPEQAVYSCLDKVQITDNTLNVRAFSLGAGINTTGISVSQFNRAEINHNNISGYAETEYADMVYIDGIAVSNGGWTGISNNTILVDGQSPNYSEVCAIYPHDLNGYLFVDNNTIDLSSIAQLSEMTLDSTITITENSDRKPVSQDSSIATDDTLLAAARGWGICLWGVNGDIEIDTNTLNMLTQTTAGDEDDLGFFSYLAEIAALQIERLEVYTYSEGITVEECNGTVAVTGNRVDMHNFGLTINVNEASELAAYCRCNSEAYGLDLWYVNSLPQSESHIDQAVMVENNEISVAVEGVGAAIIEQIEAQDTYVDPFDAAMEDIVEEIAAAGVEAIYLEMLLLDLETEITAQEKADTKVTANVTAGGIIGLRAPDLHINGNLVEAMARAMVLSGTEDNVGGDKLKARGNGNSWSIGIGLVDCPSASVSNNTVDNEALVLSEVFVSNEDTEEDSKAVSSNEGISLGICNAYYDEPDDQAEATHYTLNSSFIDNSVRSTASAFSAVGAFSELDEANAVVKLQSMTLSAGIASNVPASDIISGNNVEARSIIGQYNEAESISSNDPRVASYHGTIATGIYSNNNESGVISNNESNAMAMSDLLMYAENNANEVDTTDTSLQTGGIDFAAGLVTLSDYQTISGNTLNGNAASEIEADVTDEIDLNKAALEMEIYCLGAGLFLLDNEGVEVQQNNLTSEASLVTNTTLEGTFIEYDIAEKCVNVDVLTYEAQANINYNNLGGQYEEEVDADHADESVTLSIGLAPVFGDINAQYNYWGDVTGPSSYIVELVILRSTEDLPQIETPPSGFGASLLCLSEGWLFGAEYEWWLSHPFEDLYSDNVGYYGFGIALNRGWNTLSAPMALENEILTNAAGTGIADISQLDFEIAYYYDPVSGWEQVVNGYVLNPLHGIYIKMNSPGTLFMASSPVNKVPQRSLAKGQSWYLIGPTPYDSDFPYTTQMRPEDALVSIFFTPDDLLGLDQIVSPAMSNQDAWYLTFYYDNPGYNMQWGRAYWIFMENADVLAGFIFTPLPIEMPIKMRKD